jgi:hypothetical protein
LRRTSQRKPALGTSSDPEPLFNEGDQDCFQHVE